MRNLTFITVFLFFAILPFSALHAQQQDTPVAVIVAQLLRADIEPDADGTYSEQTNVAAESVVAKAPADAVLSVVGRLIKNNAQLNDAQAASVAAGVVALNSNVTATQAAAAASASGREIGTNMVNETLTAAGLVAASSTPTPVAVAGSKTAALKVPVTPYTK